MSAFMVTTTHVDALLTAGLFDAALWAIDNPRVFLQR
jgi:hypothetical protein